jgi:hypothetical protein
MSSGKREEVLRAALESFSERSPNSVVGDLMMLFPDEVVLKILICFGGEKVSFPKVDRVWAAYRNRTISGYLSLKNDRATRHRVASHFGISPETAQKIFLREQSRRGGRKEEGSTRRSAERAYKSLFDEMVSDVRDTLKRRGR